MKVQVKSERCSICNKIIPKNARKLMRYSAKNLFENDIAKIYYPAENELLIKVCSSCLKDIRNQGKPILVVLNGQSRAYWVQYEDHFYWLYELTVPRVYLKTIFIIPKKITLVRMSSGKHLAFENITNKDLCLELTKYFGHENLDIDVIITVKNTAGYIPQSCYKKAAEYSQLFDNGPTSEPIPDVYKDILDSVYEKLMPTKQRCRL